MTIYQPSDSFPAYPPTAERTVPQTTGPDNRYLKPGIYQADCLDVIHGMADNSVGICLADPPYGIGYQCTSTSKVTGLPHRRMPKILNDKTPFTDWIAPLYRAMKPGGRVICFYRWDVQEAFVQSFKKAGFKVKDQLIWNKKTHGMGDLKGGIGSQHELMLYCVKGVYHFPETRPMSIYHHKKCGTNFMTHPNEKPKPLLKNLIEDFSAKNELIFDPFGGSFSTYETAKAMDRACISCELHPEYYQAAVNRLNRVGTQTALY